MADARQPRRTFGHFIIEAELEVVRVFHDLRRNPDAGLRVIFMENVGDTLGECKQVFRFKAARIAAGD